MSASRPIDRGRLLEVLADSFGHAQFREGQAEAIEASLAGRDVVAVMPTGGGKSLLYQLPAVLRRGVTVVVSPLIALMKDQVDQLTARGLAATFINSSLSAREQDERLADAASGKVKLLYLAPERFRNERFRAAIGAVDVALLAIDEAHCISQWGHDFRPDYRRLDEARAALGRPPVMALTATATSEVRADIVRELGLDKPLTLVTGFERKNLFLSVVTADSPAAKLRAIELAIDEAGGAGIIYTASRRSAERVVEWLVAGGRSVGLYHAGLEDAVRQRVQEQFMAGELPVIVATNAFGMGIDKADIRFVVHYEFPKSLEAYYQEIGRAGRDGRPARTTLLFTLADKRIQDFFIDGANPPLELIRAVYRELLDGGERATALTVTAIAQRLQQRNEMAVASAVGILERAEVVRREGAGPDSRSRPIRVLTRIDPAALPVDPDLLARKLAADRAKLAAVIQFARHTGCRKERLLAYFGDSRRRRTCRACDPCARRLARARTLDPEEAAIAVSALEMVRAIDGKFGLNRLTGFLRGDGGELLTRLGVVSPAFGVLSQLSAPAVRGWCDALLDAGYLLKESVGDEEQVYVLRLGAEARGVLDEGHPVLLAPPERPGRKRRGARRQPMPPGEPQATLIEAPQRSRGVATVAAMPTAAMPTAATPTAAAPTAAAAAEPARPDPPPALVAALKRWRRIEAQRRAIPVHIVLADGVLHRIASEQPRTESALATIPGVGPRKLEEYGRAVLTVVDESAPRVGQPQ